MGIANTNFKPKPGRLGACAARVTRRICASQPASSCAIPTVCKRPIYFALSRGQARRTSQPHFLVKAHSLSGPEWFWRSTNSPDPSTENEVESWAPGSKIASVGPSNEIRRDDDSTADVTVRHWSVSAGEKVLSCPMFIDVDDFRLIISNDC